ncbi:MAG: hypothetical protein AMJ81_07710 [Phycisphaerae bacterium SM23_33]|nr:MAG: hypothetical protein AMJ81_07710 [Phycisphaerae bacterium SM23_33]
MPEPGRAGLARRVMAGRPGRVAGAGADGIVATAGLVARAGPVDASWAQAGPRTSVTRQTTDNATHPARQNALRPGASGNPQKERERPW